MEASMGGSRGVGGGPNLPRPPGMCQEAALPVLTPVCPTMLGSLSPGGTLSPRDTAQPTALYGLPLGMPGSCTRAQQVGWPSSWQQD